MSLKNLYRKKRIESFARTLIKDFGGYRYNGKILVIKDELQGFTIIADDLKTVATGKYFETFKEVFQYLKECKIVSAYGYREAVHKSEYLDYMEGVGRDTNETDERNERLNAVHFLRHHNNKCWACGHKIVVKDFSWECDNCTAFGDASTFYKGTLN